MPEIFLKILLLAGEDRESAFYSPDKVCACFDLLQFLQFLNRENMGQDQLGHHHTAGDFNHRAGTDRAALSCTVGTFVNGNLSYAPCV